MCVESSAYSPQRSSVISAIYAAIKDPIRRINAKCRRQKQLNLVEQKKIEIHTHALPGPLLRPSGSFFFASDYSDVRLGGVIGIKCRRAITPAALQADIFVDAMVYFG